MVFAFGRLILRRDTYFDSWFFFGARGSAKKLRRIVDNRHRPRIVLKEVFNKNRRRSEEEHL